MVEKDIIPNACIDGVPVDMIRNYESAGAEKVKLPEKVDLDSTPIFDQHDQRETRNACTIYGETHTKHDQEGRVTLDPVEERKGARIHGAREDFGRSLQGALNYYLSK